MISEINSVEAIDQVLIEVSIESCLGLLVHQNFSSLDSCQA